MPDIAYLRQILVRLMRKIQITQKIPEFLSTFFQLAGWQDFKKFVVYLKFLNQPY